MTLLHPVVAELFTPLGLVVIAVIGVLIFGRRLPEVGRSLGKGIVEFKKGLSGVEEDVTKAGQAPAKIESKPEVSEVERLRLANDALLKSNEQLRASNEALRSTTPNTNNG